MKKCLFPEQRDMLISLKQIIAQLNTLTNDEFRQDVLAIYNDSIDEDLLIISQETTYTKDMVFAFNDRIKKCTHDLSFMNKKINDEEVPF